MTLPEALPQPNVIAPTLVAGVAKALAAVIPSVPRCSRSAWPARPLRGEYASMLGRTPRNVRIARGRQTPQGLARGIGPKKGATLLPTRPSSALNMALVHQLQYGQPELSLVRASAPCPAHQCCPGDDRY